MELKSIQIKSYADTAKVWAKRSTCVRKQVGAVIFNMKTDRLLAIGYNGTAKGQVHCNELFQAPNKVSKLLGNYMPFTLYGDVLDDGKWIEVDSDEWRVLHHRFSDMFEIHAEQNAIFNLIKTGANYPVDDLAIVTTLEPCCNCAKAIAALGIKHVYYLEKYDNASSNVIKYLEDCGVKCEYIKDL